MAADSKVEISFLTGIGRILSKLNALFIYLCIINTHFSFMAHLWANAITNCVIIGVGSVSVGVGVGDGNVIDVVSWVKYWWHVLQSLGILVCNFAQIYPSEITTQKPVFDPISFLFLPPGGHIWKLTSEHMVPRPDFSQHFSCFWMHILIFSST